MTENYARAISEFRSDGMNWCDIYSWLIGEGYMDYPSPDALRLAYNRATGKYKDERKRHNQPKTYTLAEVKEELGLNDRESVEWNKDGTQTSEKTTTSNLDLRNERDLLLYHNYDPSLWSIEWSKGSKWNAIPKKGEEAVTFHSSRITVRPKIAPDAVDIVNLMESITPRAIPVAKQGKESKRVLELSLSDIHLNRLSWAGNTNSNYDLKIGVDRVRNVIGRISERMGDERFDSVIIPCGGDLFNTDGAKETTTNGTPQQNDTRFGKAFQYAIELFADTIEEMRKKSKTVLVTAIPGNHDEQVSVLLAHTIKAYFRNCPDVNVDTTGVKRKYIEFGHCLLCLGHFAEDGRQLPLIIPSESADKWGRTKYREAHGGHLHKESTIDYGGFVLRRSPSLVSPDEWTHGKGYGTMERHTTYIWHPDRGMEEIWIHHA